MQPSSDIAFTLTVKAIQAVRGSCEIYAHRRRIKIWGRAEVSHDPSVIALLMPEDYRAKPEQAILLRIEACDVNCPQHIPQKLDAADVSAAVARLNDRIAAREAENGTLRNRMGRPR